MDRRAEARALLTKTVRAYIQNRSTPVSTTASNTFNRATNAANNLKHLARVNSVHFKFPAVHLARRASQSSIASEAESPKSTLFGDDNIYRPPETDDRSESPSPCPSERAWPEGDTPSPSTRRTSLFSTVLAKLSPSATSSPLRSMYESSISAAGVRSEVTLNLLASLCSHIEAIGIDTDGLYRVNANKHKVEELVRIFKGPISTQVKQSSFLAKPLTLPEELSNFDVHVATNAIKQWVRQMPTAVIAGVTASECISVMSRFRNIVLNRI